jgi:hypothetical protein
VSKAIAVPTISANRCEYPEEELADGPLESIFNKFYSPTSNDGSPCIDALGSPTTILAIFLKYIVCCKQLQREPLGNGGRGLGNG